MLNKKLTPILKSRIVKRTEQTGDMLHIEFDDGSILKIKTGAPFKDSIAGRKVKAVRQKVIEFDLDFEDNSTAKIALAAETSSVMLRDRAGVMEYAD